MTTLQVAVYVYGVVMNPKTGALLAVAQHGRCGVCLMHMHGEPRSMQAAPMQGDAVPQVLEFFHDLEGIVHCPVRLHSPDADYSADSARIVLEARVIQRVCILHH